jgi:predicted aspartyl protease
VELLKGQSLPIFLALINGLPPEYFILDTGAPTSVLSQAYCDRVGIPYLTAHTQVAHDGAGHEVTLYAALVDRLEVAEVTVRNWTAQVIKLPSNFKIGGILSPLDTFKAIPTELDMRERKFRVYPRLSVKEWIAQVGEPVDSTPLVWDDGNVFVHAAVNGQASGWFLFDTGAAANFVSPDLARALGVEPRLDSAMQSATAGGTGPVLQGFSGELTVGASPPMKSNFMIKERSRDPEAVAPLISSGYIGVPWMSGRRLLFAPGGRQIFFTR